MSEPRHENHDRPLRRFRRDLLLRLATLPHAVERATVCAAVTQRVVGLIDGRRVQPLVYLRARHHPQESSWSERRRYCRDEYDDSTWSPFIEVAVARVCLVAALILIGLAVWFA